MQQKRMNADPLSSPEPWKEEPMTAPSCSFSAKKETKFSRPQCNVIQENRIQENTTIEEINRTLLTPRELLSLASWIKAVLSLVATAPEKTIFLLR